MIDGSRIPSILREINSKFCFLRDGGGLKSYLRRRRELFRRRKECNNEKRTFLAICAIAKNEGPYFREWIEYHRIMGVERFYIYDNSSSDETADILKPYIASGIVEYSWFPGEKMQIKAYEDCVHRHYTDTEWIAFIDLDEFIQPLEDKTIVEYLKRKCVHRSQVVANWAIFGSNGHIKKPAGLVIESYTKRAKNSWLCKSIARPLFIYQVSPHKCVVHGMTKYVRDSTLRVCHYHCKSYEEYCMKAAKGDVLHGIEMGQSKYTRKTFNNHDRNEVDDFSMVEYASVIKDAVFQTVETCCITNKENNDIDSHFRRD